MKQIIFISNNKEKSLNYTFKSEMIFARTHLRKDKENLV